MDIGGEWVKRWKIKGVVEGVAQVSFDVFSLDPLEAKRQILRYSHDEKPPQEVKPSPSKDDDENRLTFFSWGIFL